MDALELLTADHNRVRGMFTRFQAAEGSNLKEEGPEAGRHPNQGTKGADRPYGGSTARAQLRVRARVRAHARISAPAAICRTSAAGKTAPARRHALGQLDPLGQPVPRRPQPGAVARRRRSL